MKITIEATIMASNDKVWTYYTSPSHIIHWNAASDDWCCPHAENELHVGGKYKARMESKDKQYGFDFEGTYTKVTHEKQLTFTLEDNREVDIIFTDLNATTRLIITFDAETENSVELQKSGWQSILNNFKLYVETH